MIQEIGSIAFDNQFKAGMKAEENDFVFVFEAAEKGPDRIMLGGIVNDSPVSAQTDSAGKMVIPRLKDLDIDASMLTYAFSLGGDNFYMAMPGNSVPAPEGFSYESNRVLRKAQPKELAFAAMTACHLNIWYKDNQYCGRCGSRAVHDSKLRMVKCPECGNMIFPKICPAVTVAVIHEDKLLVSRYNGRAQTNAYALIAGFVEIGESAEECVAREVMEEVGLKVKNIRYYGSQPWGFVGNLQIGYIADVDGSAEITLDEEELATAFFISREELEPIENRPALTQEMIEDFRTGRLK